MQSTGEKRKMSTRDAMAIIGGFVFTFLGLGLSGMYYSVEWLKILSFGLMGLGIGLLVYGLTKFEEPAFVLTISGEKGNRMSHERESLWAGFIIVGFGLGMLFNNLLAGLMLGFGLGLIADVLVARAGPRNK